MQQQVNLQRAETAKLSLDWMQFTASTTLTCRHGLLAITVPIFICYMKVMIGKFQSHLVYLVKTVKFSCQCIVWNLDWHLVLDEGTRALVEDAHHSLSQNLQLSLFQLRLTPCIYAHLIQRPKSLNWQAPVYACSEKTLIGILHQTILAIVSSHWKWS